MQISFKTQARHQTGYALIMIMTFLAVGLTIFASMMYWVSSNAKITLRNNAFVSAEAAAESATETRLASMVRDFAFGGLNPAGSYTSLVPSQNGWPIQYQFTDVGLSIGTKAWTNLPSQFAGCHSHIPIRHLLQHGFGNRTRQYDEHQRPRAFEQ
jgi:hypothetical protein